MKNERCVQMSNTSGHTIRKMKFSYVIFTVRCCVGLDFTSATENLG